jgi:peptidoglycan/xylan/chitin deacetylase (PgdA/CDA1 family)
MVSCLQKILGEDAVRLKPLLAACVLGLAGVQSANAIEFEPRLKVAADGAVPTVALTFDACSGGFDRRIMEALVAANAKATIFVTERWLKKNPAAFAELRARPDLFEIENHGANHVPAVTDAAAVFGIRSAATIEGVAAEIDGGAAAIEAATGARPRWFRGATARYSGDALALIAERGMKVAGYSVNGDMGASLPAHVVKRRFETAQSGDVVIAHINQPGRAAGQGAADGVRALAKAGVRFVRLDEVETRGDDGRPLLAARHEVDHKLHVQRDDHRGGQRGEGGHPAGSHELTHLGAAGGDPDQRDHGEGQLQAQDHLTENK